MIEFRFCHSHSFKLRVLEIKLMLQNIIPNEDEN